MAAACSYALLHAPTRKNSLRLNMVHPLKILPGPFPSLTLHTNTPTHSHTLHPSQVPLSAGVELWISSLLSSLRSSLHQLLMSAITHDRGSFSLEECVHHNITQVATMALFFHWAKECELVRRTAAKVHYPKAATEPPSSLPLFSSSSSAPCPHLLLLFFLLFFISLSSFFSPSSSSPFSSSPFSFFPFLLFPFSSSPSSPLLSFSFPSSSSPSSSFPLSSYLIFAS